MKRILVALDSSRRAPIVLAAAAQLAERCGAKLVLFQAIGIPAELPRDVYARPDLLEHVLRDKARGELDRLAATVRPELVERIAVDIGTAADAIVRAGREAEVDLIAIGSHGFGGIDRVLGTVAAKVVNHADRNVLVVRTPL